MRRIILCEGPDDLAALRELGIFLYGGKALKIGPSSGGAGEERKVRLQAGTAVIDLVLVPNKDGKTGLPKGLAEQLHAVPPIGPQPDEGDVALLATVFDPDSSSEAEFHGQIQQAIAGGAPAWTLNIEREGVWSAHRGSETLTVHCVAWRGPGPVVDALPDHQNIERLLCAIAARAYPQEATLVERWTGEITTLRKPKAQRWKVALHLWCALVCDKASEHSAAARFLHQDATCKPHVETTLGEVGLVEALRPLLQPA
jgi:hypothetical protein